MGGRVFNVNKESIEDSPIGVSWSGFPYLCNLLGEFSHFLLKLYKGLTNLMAYSRGMFEE